MRAFLALLLVAAATAELAPLLKHSEPIQGKYIIKLKDEYDVDDIASTVSLSGGRVGNKFRHVLNGFAAELSDKILRVVRSLAAVEYVEQEGVYRTQVTWGLDRIDQRNLPLNNYYGPRGTGSGYTVWVIDTGVRDTHNEFSGRAQQVANFAGGINEDCNGHGTHCAGTVGSDSYGVATGVQIRGIKTLGCLGSGSTSGIISGCDYVVANADGNSIASMSLGGGASSSLDRAVRSMISAGIPTAVAAGNDDADACNYSPARTSSAITVGATDSSDVRSTFSNYGSCLDIFAPGTYITSTWHNSDSATKTISGTSMACPHVAGAIALYGKSTSAMLANTSNDKISNVGGSVNKLLYV
ncbi:aqualysin-1-like [Diadema setosum]|uniref:aqualysin-1-like n=1 Tax=Diadema setosum TaxID=31175 RepID=UPI003B3B1239